MPGVGVSAVAAHLDDWGVYLAAVGGGLAALGWIFKHLRSGFKQAGRMVKRIDVLGDMVERELANNGGKTLKDKTDRTSEAVDALAETLDAAVETVDVIAEKVERLQSVETKLDGHLQWSQSETERRAAEEARLWAAIEALKS